MYFTVYSKSLFHLTIPVLTWENRRHSATSPLVSTPNDVWKTSAEIHRYRWHGTIQICVVRRIGGKFSLTNQKYYPDLGIKFLCPFIGPCPHEPGDFFNRTSFIRIRVNGALNHSGKRFQNNAVSVSGFTGFVKTEGRFVYKGVLFQKCLSGFMWN